MLSAVALPDITAVGLASGRAVVARRDDFIVCNNHGSILPAKAGRTGRDGFCDIQIVVVFVYSHSLTSRYFRKLRYHARQTLHT